MAFIFDYAYQNRRIVMGREELTRRMAWLGNWQRIRIGVRCAFISPGVQGQYVAPVVIGIFSSSGVGGGFLADRSEAYVGVATGASYPATLNLGATGSNISANWSGQTTIKKVDSTTTLSNSGAQVQFVSVAPTVARSILIADFTKSATGTWAMSLGAPSSAANALTDKTYTNFFDDACRSDATPSGYVVATVNMTAPGTPFVNKVLDTVSVTTTSSALRLMIQDIIIVRLN